MAKLLSAAVLSILLVLWYNQLPTLPPVLTSPIPAASIPDTFPPCGFDPFFTKSIQQFPQRFQQMEAHRYRFFSENRPSEWGRTVFTIPVVYHIVHQNGNENISDERIQKSLEQLNAGFADTGYFSSNGVDVEFRFCLAKRSPDGNATTGINRISSALTSVDILDDDAMKALSQWDPKCYVNIWVVKDILEDGASSRIAGYANYPSIHGRDGDGIVCEAKWIGSRPADETVLIHEMGHYFGLYHTFNGGCTNGDCLTDGDQVCDTPPDQSTAAVYCDAEANSCTTDSQSGFASDQQDMYQNFMDYGLFDCQNVFTLGQKERMIYFLTNWRKSLLECNSCQDPCPVNPALAVTADQLEVGVGETVEFSATAEHIETINWRLNNQVIGTGDELSYAFDSPGIYTLQVEGLTGNLSCQDQQQTLVIRVYCPEEASIEASALEVEAGSGLQFSGSAEYASTYEWRVDGVPVGTGPTLEHTFTGGGDQIVSFRALSSGGCSYAEVAITVSVLCSAQLQLQDGPTSGPIDSEQQFSAIGNEIDKISWSINGESVGEGDQLNYTFEAPGSYQVKLTGTNLTADCFVERFFIFTAFCPTEAIDFNLPSPITVGQEYTFTLTDPTSIANAQWFIDGIAAGSGPRLTYQFEDSGTYSLSLEAESVLGSCPDVDLTRQLEVNCPSGLVELTNYPSSPVVGQTVTLTAEKTGIDKELSWLINGELVGQGDQIDYSFMEEGQYTIRVTADPDLHTCPIYYDEVQLSIACPAAPKIEADQSTGEVGEEYTFAASSEMNGTFEWWIGNQLINTAPILSYSFSEPGTHEIVVRLFSDNSCSGLSSSTIFEATCPERSINFDLEKEIFSLDEIVTLRADTENPDSIIWLLDHQVIGAGNNFTYQFSKSGLFELAAFTRNSHLQCAEAYAFHTIEVECTIQAMITADKQVIAQGDSILLSANLTGNEQITWYLDGQEVNSESSFYLSPDAAGSYEISAVISNGSCSVNSNYLAIYVRSSCEEEINFTFDYVFRGGSLQKDNNLISSSPSHHFYIDGSSITSFNDDFNINWQTPELDPLFGHKLNPITKELAFITSSYPYEGSYLMGINESGAIGFSKYFTSKEPEVNHSPIANGLEVKPNGHYVTAHYVTAQFPNFLRATVLSEIDPSGDMLWQRNYDQFLCRELEVAADRAIYAAGENRLSNQYEMNIIKTLDDGSPQWSKLYQWKEDNEGWNSFVYSGNFRMLSLPDGSFIVRYLYNHTSFLLRLDSDGHVMWAKKWIAKDLRVQFGQLNRCQDGNLLFFLDDFDNGDIHIYGKISPDGEILWTKQLVSNDFGIYNFIETKPNKYMLVISANNGIRLMPVTERGILGGCEFDDWPVKLIDTEFNVRSIELGEKDGPFLVTNDSANPIPIETSPQAVREGKCKIPEPRNIAATLNIVDAQRCGNQIHVKAELCNNGEKVIPFGPDLVLYDGDPTLPESKAFGSVFVSKNINPGNCDTLAVKVNNFSGFKTLYLSYNDSFELFQDDDAEKLVRKYFECDYSDNIDHVNILNLPETPPLPDLDIGPAEITLCHTSPSIIGVSPDGPYQNPIWNDGLQAYQRTISTPGTYTLKVYDDCNRTYESTVVARAEQNIDLDLGPDRLVCNQQVFTFEAPTGFASYRWPDESTERSFTTWKEGPVWVEVTDACGQVKTDTVQVRYNPATVFDLGPDTLICQGASVSLHGIAGFDKYQWYPEKNANCSDCMETVLSPDITTTFYLVATDINGCISSDTLRIEVARAEERTESVRICEGETAMIFGQMESTPGLYSQTFQSQSGCDSTVNIRLEVSSASSSEETQTICAGESALIFGQPQTEAGDYSQSFGGTGNCDSTHTVHLEVLQPTTVSQTINLCEGQSITLFGQEIDQAGKYEQTFTAANGCDSTQIYEVILQEVIHTQEQVELCRGSSIQLFDEQVSEAGTYSKTFTTAGGCDSIHQVEVVTLEPVLTTEQRSICAGETTVIFGEEQSESGLYEAIFPAGNGCDSTHQVMLQVLESSESTSHINLCSGETYTAFDQVFSEAGTYTFTLTNSVGCDSTYQLEIEISAPILTEEQLTICAGDSVLVFGAYVYTEGRFDQSFTAANGCDSLHRVQVILFDDIELTAEINPACAGQLNGQITVPDLSGLSYKWSDGSTGSHIEQLAPGTYALTVTNDQGCSQSFSYLVTERTYPQYDISWEDPSCPGEANGSIDLMALQDSLQFGLAGEALTPTSSISQLPPGGYDLRIQDAAGCIYSESVTLLEPPALAAELTEHLQLRAGNSLLLPLSVDTTLSLTYAWSPGQWLSCTDCPHPVSSALEDISYQVTIQDAAGCNYVYQTQIEILPMEEITPPNAFSPNGDGKNETFVIPGIEQFPEAELIIVNRWGSVVYAAQPYQNDWDGRSEQGKVLPEGTYYYLLRLDITSETPITGPVTIIR